MKKSKHTPMTERWQESFDEYEETIRKIAESDLPLSDDFKQLIEEYEND